MRMLKGSEKRFIDFSVKILEDLRKRRPLIHIISNFVTVESVADMVLATGALPVAAHAPEEVSEVTDKADALLLNTGTPDKQRFEAYLKAGKAAKKKDIPIIFDPVGAGLSTFRIKITEKILKEIGPTIIRMNQGEAGFIVNSNRNHLKGVDSISGSVERYDLERFARENSVLLVVTGRVDIVTDGSKTFKTELGSPVLTEISGGGCMLDAVIASFAASSKGSIFERAVSALIMYNYLATKLGKGDIKRELIALVRNFPKS